MPVSAIDRRLLAAIEDGLPLTSRPYRDIGLRLGIEEDEVIRLLRELLARGVVRRFGLVVRHRALGFVANAMAVWDAPDTLVGEAAGAATAFPFVTLCYRRDRRPPLWPYNLFCMIHGRDRGTVGAQIAQLNRETLLGRFPHAVLFSRRCFKQRGARYGADDRREIA